MGKNLNIVTGMAVGLTLLCWGFMAQSAQSGQTPFCNVYLKCTNGYTTYWQSNNNPSCEFPTVSDRQQCLAICKNRSSSVWSCNAMPD